MTEPWLTVLGVGVDLPVAGGLADLAACLHRDRPLVGERRRFEAAHTDLAPVDVEVGLRADGAPVPPRQRALPRESRLAARAAEAALAGAGLAPAGGRGAG